MKHILMIATGGTIASTKSKDGLLSPTVSNNDLIKLIPGLEKLCDVKSIQPINKDSTNMTYQDWFELSQLIKDKYNEYDGFVITHGTDTLGYGATALSYLIQQSNKPIIFTGAQKPITEIDTDARTNLYDAFLYCCDPNSKGVKVVFNRKIICGTHAKKIKSKSFDAFDSIDYPTVGKIEGNTVKQYHPTETKPEVDKVIFAEGIVDSVIVIKLIPGLSAKIFLNFLDYKAIIIEGFGVGGIPTYRSNEFEEVFKQLKAKGIKIIIATQVHCEGTDMDVYEVGKVKKELGLLEARNMTIEACVGKAVWALYKAKNDDEFNQLFNTAIDHDIV